VVIETGLTKRYTRRDSQVASLLSAEEGHLPNTGAAA